MSTIEANTTPADQPRTTHRLTRIGARLTATACCAAALAVLGGCQTTTQGGAVGGDRRQLLLVSSEELEQTAAQGYLKLKTEATTTGTLNKDPALLRRVTAIAGRLTPQTGVFRADAPGWKWEANVITSDQVNAFCMPGGKIMVYTGLAQQLKLSDDELAVVMGHEMAHALREHSREQVSQAMAAQTAIGVGAAVLGLGQASTEIAGTVYESLIASRFSRADETEADRIGLELMARAGYDPRAGVSLWQKMGGAKSGSAPPAFLSSHPTDEKRAQTIQGLLPTVMPLYQEAVRR